MMLESKMSDLTGNHEDMLYLRVVTVSPDMVKFYH